MDESIEDINNKHKTEFTNYLKINIYFMKYINNIC
jgi:hypothetical protein